MLCTERVKEIYTILHEMPEPGFQEYKTGSFIATTLVHAGYEVQTEVAGTGVIGTLHGKAAGPVFALRADMDALRHVVDGKECAIHSCGHDANSAMALAVAEEVAKRGIRCGTFKVVFQPAEETLFGALRVIETGKVEDIEILLGIHLRPEQEAKRGQATPALYHGASYIIEANIAGVTAHGARPHLGVNVIDAAAAVVNAINAIHMNPVKSWSVKVTKLHAGGASLNAIPDQASLAFDLRAQDNTVMDQLIDKVKAAVEHGAATVGAKAAVTIKGGVPAAVYDSALIEMARNSIAKVLGEKGVLDTIITPGGEDFHFFAQKKSGLRTAYIGLGCDLTPGLHHPAMKFEAAALADGVNILLDMVDQIGRFER